MTTPDSPKGPPLRVRIAQAMAAHPSLGGLYSDHPDSYLKPHADVPADYVTEADAVLAVVEVEIDRVARARDGEVERLTAEVERLRAELEGAEDGRDYLKRGVTKALNPLFTDEQVDKLLINPVRLAELTAGEVSRLREQLAAPQALPQEFRQRAERAMASVDDNEEHLDECDSPAECHAAAKNFAWRMAATLVETALGGVSSSEVEAPQPQEMTQHKVNVVVAKWDPLIAFATCRECLEKISGDAPFVQDWADQHEADTLRPKVAEVPGGSAILNVPGLTEMQEDALLARIAELTEVMTERIRSAMPVSQHVDGESGETFWTVQVVHAAKVAARVIAQLELQQRNEGRPSGSERLAPRPSNLAVWMDEDEREFDVKILDITKVATIQFEDGELKEVLLHELQPRQDAAQAARSEATPRTWDINASEPREAGLKVKGDINGVVFERREVPHDPARWRALPPEGDGGYYSWRVMNHGLFAEAQSFTEVLPCAAQEEKKEGAAGG